MTKGIHRVSAKSKIGRRLRKAKGARPAGSTPFFTASQLAWNARIEAKKRKQK